MERLVQTVRLVLIDKVLRLVELLLVVQLLAEPQLDRQARAELTALAVQQVCLDVVPMLLLRLRVVPIVKALKYVALPLLAVQVRLVLTVLTALMASVALLVHLLRQVKACLDVELMQLLMDRAVLIVKVLMFVALLLRAVQLALLVRQVKLVLQMQALLALMQVSVVLAHLVQLLRHTQMVLAAKLVLLVLLEPLAQVWQDVMAQAQVRMRQVDRLVLIDRVLILVA